MAKKGGTDLDSYQPSTGRRERRRPSDVVEMLPFPDKKWVTIRLVGGIFPYAGYWVKQEPKQPNSKSFYVECPSFDPAAGTRDDTRYDPWRDAAERINTKENRIIGYQQVAYMNAISRAVQRKMPKKVKPTKAELASGFKDIDSDTDTPFRCVRLTANLVEKIQKLRGLNTVETKKETKSYNITDEEFGCDVRIMYDKDAATPANMYEVQLGERTPLTKAEKEYLMWDLSELQETPTEQEAKRNFEGWAKRVGIKLNASKDDKDDDVDFDDEDDGFGKSKKGKQNAAKGKKATSTKKEKGGKAKAKAEPEEDFEDDFDDEDEAPKTKKGKAKKSKSEPEKKPAKKSAKADKEEAKPAKSKKGKKADVEDKPKAKTKTKKGKKSKADEDDDIPF